MAKDPVKQRKGRSAKQRGSKEERKIAKALTELGCASRRVAMSGAQAKFDSRLAGDIQIGLMPPASIGALVSRDYYLLGESKVRGDGGGFKMLDEWLGENDVLFVRRNYKPTLVVMPWEQWTKLLLSAYHKDVPNWREILPEFQEQQEKARRKRPTKDNPNRPLQEKKRARQKKVQSKKEAQT